MIGAYHQCNFVTRGEAAVAVGKPYQYIYGLYERANNSVRPGLVETHSKPVFNALTGKTKYVKLVCLQCVTNFYGKTTVAEENDPGDIRVEPFIGYRGWEISNDGSRLVSDRTRSGTYTGQFDTSNRFAWEPGKAEAVCANGHPAPSRTRRYGSECGCGLYAVSVPEMAYDRPVVGAVELWGRFFEGDTGFRAQFGKPIAVACQRWARADEIHRLGIIYEIPVVHSLRALVEVATSDLLKDLELEEEVTEDEHWSDSGDGRSPAAREAEAEARAGVPAPRAGCRTAAGAGDSIRELRRLIEEGVISPSNAHELFLF